MSVQAEAWAWAQKAGSPVAKSVLVALANYANESGYSDATQVTLAEMTELSERSVRRHVLDLEKIGLLVREPCRLEDGTVGPDGIWLQMHQRPLWPVDQRTVSPADSVAGGANHTLYGKELKPKEEAHYRTEGPAVSVSAGSASRKKRILPEDFGISPSIREWATKQGFATFLDAHLDYFRDYCAANRATYTDFDAAFRNCIRADWGSVRKQILHGKPIQSQTVPAPICEFRGKQFNPASEPCGMPNATASPHYGGRKLCPHHRHEVEHFERKPMPDEVRAALKVKRMPA